MLDFTVAIRTHNRAEYLPALLDKLKSQVQTEAINWEVLVVDNNSIDNTAQIIQTFRSSWPKHNSLRYIFEPVQGAAVARHRAFQEAKGRWVGFLDDDNLPAEDWVYQAYTFGQAHPNIGAYGGQIHANFEVQPPQDFGRIANYLAVINRGNSAFCYDHVLPPGTNIVIAKQAWVEAVPQNTRLLGPEGKSLVGKGEDIELLSYLQQAGWEIWYAPSLECCHNIPAWRLERDYLLSLAWGVGVNRYRLRMIRLSKVEKSFMPLMYLLNDFRKLVHALLKNYKTLAHDTVSAFEVILSASILLSPVYSVWNSHFKNQPVGLE